MPSSPWVNKMILLRKMKVPAMLDIPNQRQQQDQSKNNKEHIQKLAVLNPLGNRQKTLSKASGLPAEKST